MRVQVQRAARNRITGWMVIDEQDALVVDVIARLEQITAPLTC